jgi:triacylglycerol lipase
VRVSEAALPGAADFRVVPYRHTFILARAPVIAQVLHFLRHGRFAPGAPPVDAGPEAGA